MGVKATDQKVELITIPNIFLDVRVTLLLFAHPFHFHFDSLRQNFLPSSRKFCRRLSMVFPCS